MKKTAIWRSLATSIPAALIAATTLSDASTIVPTSHSPLVRAPFAARPVQAIVRFANSTPRTTFVAGGATLPAAAYVGSSAFTSNPGLPVAGSVLAQIPGVSTQYCQTGSGFGRGIFTGADGLTAVNLACPALGVTPVVGTNGFGAPAALGLTSPDITGTDVPMSQTDYSTFIADKTPQGFGEPVSVPSIIGSVAILYNLNGVTAQVPLSDVQICSIVAGTITNWQQINKSYPNTPLFFVYRADGSGTTFSFANHLVNVCKNPKLSVSQAFTAPTGTVSVVGPTVPANFVGEAGNVGIANEVATHNGYAGYVESANALSVRGGTVNFATVNGKDPIKNLPETAAHFVYNGSDVAPNAVVVTNGGAATVAPLSPAPPNVCVEIAIPTSYANIKQGYPIIAVTNVLFNEKGNGTNSVKLQGLVNTLNTPADFGAGHITTVDPATKGIGTGTKGYSALGSSFNAPLKGLAKSCIGA